MSNEKQPKEYVVTEDRFKRIQQKLDRMAQAFDTIYNHLQEHTTNQYLQTAVKFERAHLVCDSILGDIHSRPVSTPPEGAAPKLSLDITGSEAVEISICDDRKVIWVNTAEQGCILRVCQIHNLSIVCPEHDAAIAQAAREKVLDEVDTFLDSWLEGCSLSGAECMSLCDCLRSLRQHKE